MPETECVCLKIDYASMRLCVSSSLFVRVRVCVCVCVPEDGRVVYDEEA